MLGDVLRGPVTEIHVQQALIAAVERALSGCESGDRRERLLRWSEYEYTGIEAVRPADIGRGREFLALEQLVAISYDLETR